MFYRISLGITELNCKMGIVVQHKYIWGKLHKKKCGAVVEQWFQNWEQKSNFSLYI